MNIFTPEARIKLAEALSWNITDSPDGQFLEPHGQVRDDHWVWRLICRAVGENIHAGNILLNLFNTSDAPKMDHVQHVVPAINLLRDYPKLNKQA